MLDDCLPYLCVLLVSFYIKKTKPHNQNSLKPINPFFNSILVRGVFMQGRNKVVQWSFQLVTSGSILVRPQEKLS